MTSLMKNCNCSNFGVIFNDNHTNHERINDGSIDDLRIDNDESIPDNEVMSFGNYIERKCDFCDFKTTWHSEMMYHVRTIHESKLLEENVTVSNLTMETEEIVVEPDIETVLLNYEYNNEENDEALNEDNGNCNVYDQVFKCPNCDFQSFNVTQFHFHFVTHSDQKLFECSICHYRSTKRWSIIKHMNIKFAKDKRHDHAKVLNTNEIGCLDYSKYNQYLIRIENDEKDHMMSTINTNSDSVNAMQGNFKCVICGYLNPKHENVMVHIQIAHNNQVINEAEVIMNNDEFGVNKERSHFRCAHCNQVSNWKHVIQRHCRIKHNGDIKVIIVNKFGVEKLETERSYSCPHCGFSCESFTEYELHVSKHVMLNDNQQELQEPIFQNYNEENMEMYNNSTIFPEEPCYKCSFCNFRTDVIENFLNHFRSCTGDNFQKQISDYGCVVEQVSNESDSQNVNNIDVKNDQIHDFDTKLFAEIPLVWVSRMGNFVKMYKCRFCPHVNVRKSNISDHEKMHRYREIDPAKPNDNLHRCNDCSYVCNNAGVLSNHLKVHRGFFGVILRLYDSSKTDHEQIDELLAEQNLLTVNF